MQPPGLLVREEIEDLSGGEPLLDPGPEFRRQQVTVRAEKGASKPVTGNQERRKLFGEHIVLPDVEPGLGGEFLLARMLWWPGSRVREFW